MYKSDPEVTQPGFFGQYGQLDVWMQTNKILTDLRHIPTGRLRLAAPFLTPEAKWLGFRPPDEQMVWFDNPIIVRDPIRAVFQDLPSWYNGIVSTHPFPRAVYTCPHWMSTILTEDDNINPGVGTLGGVRWLLYYGDGVGLLNLSYEPILDQTNLSINLFDVDSQGTPGSLDWPWTGIGLQGWGLFLVKRTFTQETGIDSVDVTFHIYGGWHLKQDPDLPLAIFDATQTSEWSIFYNPLNFPPHQMFLSPLQ